jgi:hypothetical protein
LLRNHLICATFLPLSFCSHSLAPTACLKRAKHRCAKFNGEPTFEELLRNHLICATHCVPAAPTVPSEPPKTFVRITREACRNRFAATLRAPLSAARHCCATAAHDRCAPLCPADAAMLYALRCGSKESVALRAYVPTTVLRTYASHVRSEGAKQFIFGAAGTFEEKVRRRSTFNLAHSSNHFASQTSCASLRSPPLSLHSHYVPAARLLSGTFVLCCPAAKFNGEPKRNLTCVCKQKGRVSGAKH